MSNLTKALMEELTVEYVKVGPLQIPESVVISWVILADRRHRLDPAYQKPEGGPYQQASGRAGNGLHSQAPISLKVCWAKRAGAMCLT